nr:retrovirus-related Pol polyprotein from transposon TNT 1-94 [Tanacetum cinerariifolium]
MYLSLVTNVKEERQSQFLLFMQTNWNLFGHPITGLVYVVLQVVQIVLWYLDSGCSRYMTGDRSKLINYVDKFIGTVRFGNDEFATDYPGCQDTRKSTSGSAQFLGDRLVSWSSKKQKSTAISTTEGEYIALSGCCAQVLWMRS